MKGGHVASHAHDDSGAHSSIHLECNIKCQKISSNTVLPLAKTHFRSTTARFCYRRVELCCPLALSLRLTATILHTHPTYVHT